jgi:hypothetical protein
MIVIRRLVDRQKAYTAIFLPGEEPRIFPTTEYEHGRILQIYKQDRAYEGIVNDFSDYDLAPARVSPTPAPPSGSPGGRGGRSRRPRS